MQVLRFYPILVYFIVYQLGVALLIDIIGDKSELFVEEKLVIPDFVRVTEKSIIFYCSPDLINYMLIHSDSAINIVSDLKNMNVLKNYHLIKRIDQGWYFIYY